MCTNHHLVTRIIKTYDYVHGCTCPILVQLDDGRQAVFKYPNNPQGIIVLFNEYISYQLAASIGITCPAAGLAEVTNSTTFGDSDITRYVGIGFYSEYIPVTIPASLSVLKRVGNLDEACSILLFDEIVKNNDRYANNVLISANATPARLYVIDHSHTFGNPNWDQSSLSFNDLMSPYVFRENEEMYNMFSCAGADFSRKKLISEAQRIQSVLTEDCINACFKNIPCEWLHEIGEDKTQYAKQYILNRTNNLNMICDMICRERGV